MNLLKSSGTLLFGIIISNLLAYAFHLVAGRMLGPEDYGTLGALLSLYLIVALPGGALAYGVSKFTTQYHLNLEFGKMSLLRRRIQFEVLVFSGILFVLIYIFSSQISDFLKINSPLAVILMSSTIAFALILPINRGLLQGMKKFQALSLNNIFEAFSRFILLVAFTFLGYGIHGAILAYGIGYLIAFLLVFPFIKEVTDASVTSDSILIKPVRQFIFKVLLLNVIIQLLLNVPTLYIKHYYSSAFTGYWIAALNITRISLSLTSAISLVMFPEIIETTDLKLKRKIFIKSLLLVFLATSAMALVFILIPGFILNIMYGQSYTDAIPLLKILGVAMIFVSILQLSVDCFLAKIK
ncbi:MAG: oligosaccharide flippase family protein [Saprospiraceae bacterium]